MIRVHPLAAVWSAAVEVFLREHARAVEGEANDLKRLRRWQRTHTVRHPHVPCEREAEAREGEDGGGRE